MIRFLSLAAKVALLVLSVFAMPVQSGAQVLSIANYRYVSQKPVTITKWDFTYQADLVNAGPALASVTATLTSLNPASFTVVPGQDTLTFAPVPANSQVHSNSTTPPCQTPHSCFTIRVDRTVPFDNTFGKLSWAFQSANVQPPVANAGANQTVRVGATVTLNGSASTNPSGIGTLTYSWAFASRPPTSAAMLMNPTSVMPTFVVDVGGTYNINLTVSNGQASNTASVTVSTGPVTPIANAGPDQTIQGIGKTVHLTGSGSADPNGNALTYAWTFSSVPVGSTASLSGPNSVTPTFVTDKIGTYKVQLIVNNGFLNSAPSFVTITDQDVKPVANAGSGQSVNIGSTVQLDGSKSTSFNGSPLTYKWSLISKPQSSMATLSNPNIVNPTFVVDAQGDYVAQLIVNDGLLDSDAVTVTVSTNQVLAPTAHAGQNQTVGFNSVVQLNGSGTDPQNLPLTYAWSFTAKPSGSNAALSNAAIANPTFVADKTGNYVAQLIVNNGILNSAPATVMISTTCTQPAANAGSDQTVTIGATVTLNGSASSDPCQDPLTYSWTFNTRPNGSNASLTGANTVSPTFVADAVGMFVVQLVVNNGFQLSNPTTVSINVVPQPVISLTPNPLTVPANGSGTLTVTLSAAAGGSGQVINLDSSNKNAATVPGSVTVQANQKTATFTVTPVAVGTTTITASATGFVSGTATANVVAPLNITGPSSLSNGVQNMAYTATTITSSGGTTPLTWSIAGQPDGLSINSSTGAISGTPTVSGTFNTIVVTVKDSSTPQQTATKTYSMTIAQALSITGPSSLSNGVQNVAYTATTITSSGGTTPLTWSIAGQPAGLSINSSTGVISGTPTANGTFNNVVVTVKDASTPQQTATKTYSMTIAAGLTITGPNSLSNGVQNVAYTATTITSSGGTTPLTWSIAGQPAGLSIDASTGVISGTPTATGPFNSVVVTVKDASTPPQTATKTYSMTIAAGLTITGPNSLPNGVQNVAYTATTITSSGGTTPLTWSLAGQPAGLSIDASTGAISGTPTATGPFNSVVVTVKDSSTPQQTATKTYSMTIAAPLSITGPSSLPNGVQNVAYTATTITSSGGTTPLTWSIAGQPAGLSIDASTGAISGTPTATGPFNSVVVTVKDASTPQQTATRTYSLTIAAPLSITGPSSLPNGVQNVAYTATTITSSGGTTPLTWSIAGQPAGLSIDASTGAISGTPTATGPFNSVVVTVKDASTPQQTATKTYSMTIAAPLSITGPSSISNGVQNVAYPATTIASSGGTTPLTWSIAGQPAGLSINSSTGVISGTPTATGAFNSVVITVKDSSTPQQTATKTYSIVIAPKLAITTLSLPNGVVNTAYPPTQMALSGGTGPVTWSSSTLPTGVSISSSGLVAGVPTVTGAFNNVMITATDSGNPQQTATATYSVTIAQPTGIPVTISTVSVGKSLQASVFLTIAAQATDTTFTLASNDASILKLNAGGSTLASSIQVTIPANITTLATNVVGIGTGQTTLVATGAATGSGAVTVTPSGFQLIGPGATPSFTMNQGQTTPLTVQIAQLDNSGNIISTSQPLAYGVVNVTISLSSTSTSVGNAPASVTFQSGDFSKITTFTAKSTGSTTQQSTTLTVNTPAGFSTPAAQANQVIAIVNGVGCSLPTVNVGKYLETNTAADGANGIHVSLTGTVTQSGGLPVIVSSNDSSKFLLAVNATDTPSTQITVTAAQSASRTPDFYVVGVGNGALGTVANAISANAGSFGTCTASASLAPSGFVISAGAEGSLVSTLQSGINQQSSLSVYSMSLDPATLAPVAFQALSQPAGTVNVNITNSDPSIGSLSSGNPAVFTAGLGSAQAIFTSSATAGTTQVGAAKPAVPVGFSTPSQNASISLTVQSNVMHLDGDAADVAQYGPLHIGYHLELPFSVRLSQPTMAKLTITLTSNNPNALLLTTDSKAVGQTSIQVTIDPLNTISSQYYVQVVGCPIATQPACAAFNGNPQIATYTATGGGFTDTATITLAPAGVISSFAGSPYVWFRVPNGPTPIDVDLAWIDPITLTWNPVTGSQQLAALTPNETLTVAADTNNHSIGTITSATIAAGSSGANATFTPLAAGSIVISLTPPANFGSTGIYQQITATVFNP